MVHVTLFKNRLFLFGGIKFKITCNCIHIIPLKTENALVYAMNTSIRRHVTMTDTFD